MIQVHGRIQRINQTIREDIKTAQLVLAAAVQAYNVQQKKLTTEDKKKITERREKILSNCYEVLKDIQQTQNGGTYRPPTPLPTLKEMKQNLLRNNFKEEETKVNLQEEKYLEQMNKNDKELDDMLEKVIEVDKQIEREVRTELETINKQGEAIQKNMKKIQIVDASIVKGDKDLLEVLKQYRRPNKLCLDITLVLLVLALIGVIINLIKNG